MADRLSQIRGLLLDEAERRPSEIGRHRDGRPRADHIAKRLGVSKATVTRILIGKMSQRAGVLNPRKDEYSPSEPLLRGIKHWLHLQTYEDVWAAIENATPRSPLPSRLRQ